MDTKGKQAFLDTGYTKDQIEEIERGREAGLEVSLYSDRKFLPMQMRQIRLGLEEQLPVELYAKEEYDWFQMEEIRKGLRDGIDAKMYAMPELSYEKMRQMRKGLKQGINLKDYLRYDAGMMEQIREAQSAGIDIQGYIGAGYDAQQLSEIRQALEKNIDINPYLSREYRSDALAQIRKGLEKGIDVSLYADVGYTWRQMRELRRGIENRVDIEKYRNRLYSWDQMREIRLGLQQGINVDGYRKMRYTAGEMHKKRREMLAQLAHEHEEFLNSQVKLQDFTIEISSDFMEAYITVLTKDKVLTREKLLEILSGQGIKKGIRMETVEQIAKGEATEAAMLIAEGKKPSKGKDGWYDFFFRTNVEKKPRVLKDGSVDYKNVEWFEIVHSGQKLAYYNPAQEGEEGYTVQGVPIPASKGAEKGILIGKGFQLEADQRTYTATEDGMISLDGNRMEVVKSLVLDDVTTATGNVKFNGNVYIRGNVGKGTAVIASDDVVIDGYVEAATIQSGGTVVLKKGMNGAGSGEITADKGVMSKFFEAVKVKTGGDIQVERSLNSQLYAEGIVSCSAVIVGGTAYAKGGFQTRNVGNQAGLKTVLRMGVDEKILRENKQLYTTIREIEQGLQVLENSREEMEKKYPPEVRNNMKMYIKVESAIFRSNQQLEKLMEKKKEIEKSVREMNEAEALISGQVYDGTVFDIGGRQWDVGSHYNVFLRIVNGQLKMNAND